MSAPKKPPKKNTGKPWDQWAGENVQQYERFCAYRDMRYTPPEKPGADPKLKIGSERSIRGLAASLGLGRQTLESISSRFHWVERCEKYDLYILERAKERNEAEIVKMQETHAALASQMLVKATQRLLTLDAKDISPADLVRMVDIGVKIERLSRGESTENQKVSGQVAHSGNIKVDTPEPFDLSGLSDDELEQLEKLLGKVQ